MSACEHSWKPPSSNLAPYELLACSTFEEIKDHLAYHPEDTEKINTCAEYVLAAIRTLPMVSMHGNAWKERFQIEPEDSALDAINRIYSVLQCNLLKHNRRDMFYVPPRASFSLESFQQTYEQERDQRIRKFCIACRVFAKDKGIEELLADSKQQTSISEEGAAILRSFSAYAIQNQQEDLKWLLWTMAKEADYWEAIPLLIQAGISSSYIGEIPIDSDQKEWLPCLWRYSNQALEQITYTQARTFADQNAEISNEIKPYAQAFLQLLSSHPWIQIWGEKWKEHFGATDEMTALHVTEKIYHTLYSRLTKRRAIPLLEIPPPQFNFDCFEKLFKMDQNLRIQTFFGSLQFELARNGDPVACRFMKEQSRSYFTNPDNHSFILNLSEEAKEKGWGWNLWIATATSNYWEAIPILFNAGIAIPEGKILQLAKRCAEKNKSVEWLHIMSTLSTPQL